MKNVHPLKAWRKRNGLTQTDVGIAIGVLKSAVCRYEQGRAPEWKVMLRIHELTDGEVKPNDWLPLGKTSPAPALKAGT